MQEVSLPEIKFDANGLVPAIVQDAETNEVLMLAYMDQESLRLTRETGETYFWSRSRKELWHKGETSGNVQRVVEVRVDCDTDALLIRVHPAGPACHTGNQTCFYRGLDPTGL
jgi:phosphoribosyl-AMP cyclohydrolase